MTSPRPNGANSKQRLRLWLRLLRASRGIENGVRAFLREEFSTTLPRFDVMAALYRSPSGITMSELSRELMVSNGNVTAIVDRLERDGLVTRGFRNKDRRTSQIALTPEGQVRFEAMATAHEAWIDQRLGQLSDPDLVQAITLLDTISPTRQREDA